MLTEGIELLLKNDPHKEEIISLLERYIKEIELFNPAYGLVGVNSTDELIVKHILDSLAPLGIITKIFNTGNAKELKVRVADVGSGAGLPGIPLAIALPHCEFTLIERMGRRAGFLFNAIGVLGLSNVEIEEKEAEKVTAAFDLITFRAFKPLDTKLLKTLSKIRARDGIIAAYKGKRGKIEAEMASLQQRWEAIPYSVPFLNEERHLLVIKT